MFEIEKSINEWKRKLRTVESFEDGTIREIESHLRDEIDRQKVKGLTPEDAFARAGVHLFMILTGPLAGSYPAAILSAVRRPMGR